MSQLQQAAIYDQLSANGSIIVPNGADLTSVSLLPKRNPQVGGLAYDSTKNGLAVGVSDATVGVKWTGLIQGPNSSVNGNVPIFSGTSGQIIIDSGVPIPSITPISFAPFGTVPNASGGSATGSVVTLQPASNTNPGGVSTGAQSFGGVKTFTNGMVTTTINSLVPANFVNYTGGATVANSLMTFADTTGKFASSGTGINVPSAGVMTGVNTLSGQTVANLVSGPASATADSLAVYSDTTGKTVRNATGITVPSPGNLVGVININGNPVVTTQSTVSAGAFGSTPNANGVSISGANPQILNLQPASATQPGGITTSAQSFAGLKDFSASGITVQPTPLSSGVTSVLNNYAKWSGTMTFTGGLGATNITGVVTAERVGNTLTLGLPLVYNSGQAAAFITTTTALPLEFRPASNTESVPLFVINGSRAGASGSNAIDNGLIQLLTTGFFNIGLGFDNTETLIPFGGGAISGSGNGVARQNIIIKL